MYDISDLKAAAPGISHIDKAISQGSLSLILAHEIVFLYITHLAMLAITQLLFRFFQRLLRKSEVIINDASACVAAVH